MMQTRKRPRVQRRPSQLQYWAGVLARSSILVLPVLLLAVGGFLLFQGWFGMTELSISDLPVERPEVHLIDPDALLESSQRDVLNRKLQALQQQHQLDAWIVVAPRVASSQMHKIAAQLLNDWQVGEFAMGQGRGVLLLVAVQQNQAIVAMGRDFTPAEASSTASLSRAAVLPLQHMPMYRAIDLLTSQQLPLYLEQQQLFEGLEASVDLLSRVAG